MGIDHSPFSPPLESLPATELIHWAIGTYGAAFGVCTSFQNEGMVILDMAVQMDPAVRILTLDTGRLPQETRKFIEQVCERYGVSVEIVAPDAAEVEAMTTRLGKDLFYDDVALRQLCCQVRKVRPLEHKLREFQAYAVGLRRSQSAERAMVPKVDSSKGRLKLAPLADWSREDVEAYLKRHDVPRHPLYAKGYTSIGCAPCTRPVAPGEPERAGRWWWELDVAKECGLHVTPGGTLARRLDVLLSEVVTSPPV